MAPAAEGHAAGADAIELRAYRDEDWPEVCAVHDHARPRELEGSCDPRAFVPLAEEQEDLENFRRSEKWVACLGGRVVGFVGHDGTYLSWLYVDPAHEGRGIGRRLLRLALDHIGAGAWTIVLAGNAHAQALYESEGFAVMTRFEGDNAGYPCTCLRLARAES